MPKRHRYSETKATSISVILFIICKASWLTGMIFGECSGLCGVGNTPHFRSDGAVDTITTD